MNDLVNPAAIGWIFAGILFLCLVILIPAKRRVKIEEKVSEPIKIYDGKPINWGTTGATAVGTVLLVKHVITKDYADIVGFVKADGKALANETLFFCRYVPGGRQLQEGVTYQVCEEFDGTKKTTYLKDLNANLRVVA